MKDARTRFTARARLLAGSLLAALCVVVVGIAIVVSVVSDAPHRTITIMIVGAVLLVAGLVGGPLIGALALWRLRRDHPGLPVFLARREPSLVSDIQTYQYRNDNFADVDDKWVPTLVDARGISVWSTGLRPAELLLMRWSELGAITASSFTTIAGKSRLGVIVDVHPFRTPLHVRVGHAALGIEGSFDKTGIVAVVQATNSWRPLD